MTATPPPGLQGERTALAWCRTSLSMMVIGLLLGRLSLTSHRFTTAAASVTLLAAAVVVQIAGSSRINPTGSSKPMLLRRWLNRCVSVAVGGAALLVALTALLP